MKPTKCFQNQKPRWHWVGLLGACVAASTLLAADTNAPPQAADTNAPPQAADTNAPQAAVPPPMTPLQMFEGGTKSYDNWIDLSTGGFITSGNNAQFQQSQQNSGGAFGGIDDFHYQRDLDKTTTLTADGHALFDEHDYKLSLGLTREKLGYLRFSYNEFRTWYNGDGGFYPPTGAFYSLSPNALTLDRGEFSFEGGLTLDKVPKITFKYTHTFRDGDESSTSWGITHPAIGVTRGLSPSFYDIDEHSDAFQLDVAHHIKATDLGVGLRYETGTLNDALKITQSPGEPVQQKITDKQDNNYDLFNVHTFSETWLRKNLLFSTGFSYSDLDNDFSGSRIYGSAFDVGYVPDPQQTGFGYYGLHGGSHLHEYVTDLNLMYKPSAHVTIVPSVRVQDDDTDASASGFETLQANAPVPFSGTSDSGILAVSERLDLTYNGITNWVFYARGDWTEENGNLHENGGMGQVAGFGVPPIKRETDDNRFYQKYSAGARWYPVRRITVDVGGYYKSDHWNYNNNVDSTPNDPSSGNRYPAYLVMQDFETYDGNVRLTLRPRQNVTLVSRYEYQWSTIHTEPDPVSGLSDSESSTMTSQIIAQDVSWSPWSRLWLQAGFNYVLSETKTPVSDYVPPGLTAAPVLAAQNNYWTLNVSSGLVLDDKTDLNISYFYFRSDDYQNNSAAGVPYGAGAEEQGVTAAIVRRINKNLRLTLKYGYYHYTDDTSGGRNNYDAHLVYSSLQYRF